MCYLLHTFYVLLFHNCITVIFREFFLNVYSNLFYTTYFSTINDKPVNVGENYNNSFLDTFKFIVSGSFTENSEGR